VGPACNLKNALAVDGVVAGLDRTTNAGGRIDGQPVTGCVGVRFAESATLRSVTVTAGLVADACGASKAR
jgi:hypothetical protein